MLIYYANLLNKRGGVFVEFVLVRHVETTGNYENKFVGFTEVEYTERGKKQFVQLTDALKELKVDQIYSSPISRALKIAKKVGEDTLTDVKVIDELSEMNFGIFEGLHFTDILNDHAEHWEEWQKDYLNFTIPSGESLQSFHHRVTTFIDTIKNEEGSCMIVCHGGTVQSILTHLLDLQMEQRWHFHIPLAGIVKITYTEDYGMLHSLTTAATDGAP